jgi:hypothetical protein
MMDTNDLSLVSSLATILKWKISGNDCHVKSRFRDFLRGKISLLIMTAGYF